MQFDNTAYFPGDTLWFKAQVTSNNDDRPTELSRVLYVELTAPEGYFEIRAKSNKKDVKTSPKVFCLNFGACLYSLCIFYLTDKQ